GEEVVVHVDVAELIFLALPRLLHPITMLPRIRLLHSSIYYKISKRSLLSACRDRFSRTLIGAGEEREGIYYFTGVTVARVHRSEKQKPSSSVLWHRRLGHPSYKVLHSLPVFQKFHDFDHTNSCEICF
ncbi:unnamed protein product, partial [Brassica rapa subsp. trilocularis]